MLKSSSNRKSPSISTTPTITKNSHPCTPAALSHPSPLATTEAIKAEADAVAEEEEEDVVARAWDKVGAVANARKEAALPEAVVAGAPAKTIISKGI